MNQLNLSQYERQAVNEINTWKKKKSSGLLKNIRSSSVGKQISKSSGAVKELILSNAAGQKVAGITAGWMATAEQVMLGVVHLINDGASYTIRPNAIFNDFRASGFDVQDIKDIHQLSLENVDDVVGKLDVSHKVFAALEGAAMGAVGLPGIIVDIPALLALNLRGISTYATYYGFNIDSLQEREYALRILTYSSSPGQVSKQAALAELAGIATKVAKEKTWAELEKHAFVQGSQSIAKVLSVRLTKAKLAQIIPVAGGLVGGTLNTVYTSQTMTAASYLYRERFLMAKYGADIFQHS